MEVLEVIDKAGAIKLSHSGTVSRRSVVNHALCSGISEQGSFGDV